MNVTVLSGYLLCLIFVVGIASPALAETSQKASYSKSETSILHEKNRQELPVFFKQHQLGEIVAYSYRGGYMLPLESLVKVLGFPLRVHPGDGLAKGIIQEKDFSLDTFAHSIEFGGEGEQYEAPLVIANKDDIFIDASLLGRFFPVTFYVDTSALKLKVRLKKNLASEDKNAFRSLWKGKGETGKPEKKPASYNPDVPPELSEDNLLILQPVVAESPMDDFIEAYQEGDRYFLPLDALMKALDFPIEVDLVNGTASGWFMDEDRKFAFDMTKRKVKAGKEDFDFAKADAVIKDIDIYIDSALISKWFGFSAEVSHRSMTLEIGSDETFPFQRQMEREQRKERLDEEKKFFEEKNYPIVENPYKAADWPFVDVNLGQEYNNHSETQSITSYSIQSAGDLGYLNTKLFAAGASDKDMLQTFRIQGERKDYDGHLLGALQATEYAIGDIDSATVPLVAQTSLGRGVRVSNRPLGFTSEFDSTDFIGDAQPGWEIELYRNETLLDFQTVGSDGRYQFLKVPVLFGNNTFRLVFYGPQGQIEEEVKQIFVDSSALKKGESVYEFSVDEKSKDVFGLENTRPNHPGGVRAVGNMEYGLTDKLSLRFGTVTTPIQDGAHDYVTTGLRTGFANLYGGADFAYDASNGGWASKFTALTGIKDVNLKLEQRFFDNFVSEERNPEGILAKSQSEVDINSYFKLPLLQDMNTGLNVLYEQLENGIDQTTISNRLSKTLLGVNITNTLGAVLSDNEERFEGNVAVRGGIKGILWGGLVNYRFSPEKEVDSFNLSAQKSLSQDLFVRLGYTKNVNLDKRTITNASVTWDFHKFRVSTIAETDNEGAVFVGTSLNISFGRMPGRNRLHVQSNPMSYTGAVMADAFLDENYNKVLDGDEKVIDDPVFLVDKRRVTAEKGMAYQTQLIADQKTNVELDPNSLEDPLWIPGVEGYSIIPRSGSSSVLVFPVFATSEIDGTVTVEDEEGNAVPAKHFIVQLIDKDGNVIKTAKTEYDGFYVIDKVIPGTYTLKIAEETLEKYHVSQTVKETVDIAGKSDFFSGYDIKLARDAVEVPDAVDTDTEGAVPVPPVEVHTGPLPDEMEMEENPLPDEEYTDTVAPEDGMEDEQEKDE